MVQTRSGRALLHLAAALRAGHWSWHVAGIIREVGQARMLGKSGCLAAKMAKTG